MDMRRMLMSITRIKCIQYFYSQMTCRQKAHSHIADAHGFVACQLRNTVHCIQCMHAMDLCACIYGLLHILSFILSGWPQFSQRWRNHFAQNREFILQFKDAHKIGEPIKNG